jgi:hypothetical protein
VFTKDSDTCEWFTHGPNDLRTLRMQYVLSWIPSKVTMLHGSQWRKFFRQILSWRVSIRKCLWSNCSPMLKLLAECYSRWWELDNVPLFLKKVFHSESRDVILLRGEGCNTPGVCHQLSNGFELKHDMSSGNEGVKIKSTWWRSNLNLGHAHLLTYGPLLRLCKSNVKHAYSMYITSPCIHLDP